MCEGTVPSCLVTTHAPLVEAVAETPVPIHPGFADLVEAHYGPLLRFALGLTRHGADAADLTQQTFLLWARHGSRMRDSTKVKSWLFTTLHREFLRGWRRRQRVSFLADLPREQAEPAEPERHIDDRMDLPVLLAALDELPRIYRAPLVLFYLKEQPYLKIAARLGWPVGTVMTRLFRGKAQLRRRLIAGRKG